MCAAKVLAWAIAALATICAVLMPRIVGFDLIIDKHLLFGAGFVAFLIALHVFYETLRPAPILASVTGSIALIIWSLMMVGVISLASLGTHAALIDGALVRLDAAMGINVASIVIWLSNYPNIVSALRFFYESSTALVFLSAIALAVTNQHERLWVYCLSLIGAALVCALLSSVVPAIGAFTTFGIPADVLARMPRGAGVYFVDALEAYRNGDVRTIDVAHMTAGVVNFPSFHAVMAFAAIYAFRTIRFCAWPAYLWNAIVIVSTIPIGGHYVTDLIAGAFVWSALAMIGHLAKASSRDVGVIEAKSRLEAWLVPDRRPHWALELVAEQSRRAWDEIRTFAYFNASRDRLRN
jgi:membrane-associated phospholipid phosphatase